MSNVDISANINANMNADMKTDARVNQKKINSFFFLLRYIGLEKFSYILSFTMLIASSILAIISVRLLGKLVDQGLLKENLRLSITYSFIIILLETFSIILVWRGRKILAEVSTKSILSIRKDIFDHIHLLPISYYDRQPQGRTVTRMTHDIESIESFFTSSLSKLIISMLMFTIALIAMLLTDVKLALIVIVTMLPAVILTLATREKVRNLNRDISRLNSACNAKLSEYINGLRVIRSFGLEKWAKKKYDQAVDAHLVRQLSANTLYAWIRPLTNFLTYLPIFVLIWFGGHGVLEGTFALGTLIAFIRYTERFSHPLEALTRELHVVQLAFACVERVNVFLSADKENDELGIDGEWEIDCNELKGEIEFKNIFMRYNNCNNYKNVNSEIENNENNENKMIVDVLRDISCSIRSGEKIGFAGETGSGKTTMISLLARLYPFYKGDIFLDGVNIKKYKRSTLRRQLGFVSQDVIIFAGTIRENLICELKLSDEDVLHACRETGLYDVFIKNNLTLDSSVLENGSNFSVGERQLLALTRILLRNPSILILDEATANVDPHYENIIHTAVDRVMLNRTCIIVAHRLSTLKDCNRIFVFKEGKIVEEGDHQQLFALKGHFYDLQKNAFQHAL
ncbi:MAG: ABC transporter ATP-binding protein [Oligoflexia bacterium]|nr:ABC transporter ATP-binding protein [Oligoflexia bacterium]